MLMLSKRRILGKTVYLLRFLGFFEIHAMSYPWGKQRKQGLPPVSVCDCELGRGDWFVVI